MPPFNDATEDNDQFYSTLQAAIKDIPGHDVLLLLGNSNARVGSNNAGRESWENMEKENA
jgi:hypothetical protein